MTTFLLRHGTWLAICDGQKALLVENFGDHEFPKLELRDCFQQQNLPTHEQGTAPPGRTVSSQGGRRSATAEPDYHWQAMETFLADFAKQIHRCVEQHHISSLILIAPAKALGVLRPHLSKETRQVMTSELDRDYVKLPLFEIERHLKKLEF